MAFVLGVTGGVGTGKSAVLRMLAGLGARTLSADDLAREVLARDTPAFREVVSRFGKAILAPGGDIDRAALASIVFSDADARRDLERITHPPIIARIQSAIDEFRADPPASDAVFALEIPLIFECGLEDMVDQVLVVAAEQETQANRLTSRSGARRGDALSRIHAQMPLSRKVERADRVIWNDGDLESLARSVKAVWQEIRLL